MGLLMIRMTDRLLILAKTFSEKLFETEWAKCEHVNKTGVMLQIETQIHDVTSQLDLATQIKSTPQTSTIQPRTIEE